MYTSTMACGDNNVLILNDHVSLPIIISDWDAITAKECSAATAAADCVNGEKSSCAIHTASSTDSRSMWMTGFGSYVDDLFQSTTDGMKRKLREACAEVLKRTENMHEETIFFPVDEDARLLD